MPIPATAFIGRERDIAESKASLGRHRSVTLVGSGGIGKTRLAVQLGNELLDSYRDGVWFVDLAPIADPQVVSSVIAQVLGMSQQEGRSIAEAIPSWLERKQVLLILDNCEHVIEAVAPIATAILRNAPRVGIVATSRQALDIAGEQVLRIPPLDVPHAIADLSAAEVLEFSAVGLFVARATSIDGSFALTDDTAPIVTDICRRLDGIALAIELAAARVNLLSLAHLAERLDERFKLSAVIDWSYNLLAPQEQQLFARLGIFAGGFSLDAAANVCGEGLDELDVVDLLASLTDKSLVVADTHREHERYRLLESTAAYALEKLEASGERDALARRHAEYYRNQAEAADERLGTGSTLAWVATMELELDNFRSALTWALTQGNDVELGGATAGALGYLWRNAGLTVEGLYWIERAIQAVSETELPRVAARLHQALGNFSSGKRKYDEAERAMRWYAEIEDARGSARARGMLAGALAHMGELDAAYEANEEALAALRASEDASFVAHALNVRAIVEMCRGDVGAARETFAQALAAYRALENESSTALVLMNLAELEFGDGHPDRALLAHSEALQTNLRRKNPAQIAVSYINGAAYRIALDDLAGARDWAREGLRVARQARDELMIGIALQHLALIAALGSEGARAAQLLGYVDARFTDLRYKREPSERWGHDKLLTSLNERLSKDEIAQLLAEGAKWSKDRAVEEALPHHPSS